MANPAPSRPARRQSTPLQARPWHKPACVAAGLWTLALGVLLTATTDGAARIVAAAAVLGGILTPALALYGPFHRPTITRRVAVTTALALLGADVVASGLWAGYDVYAANRDIDVTAGATLTGGQGLRSGGTAVLHVAADGHRKSVRVTLSATDTNPALGNCAALTDVSIGGTAADDTPVRTEAGRPAVIPMAPDTQSLALRITVEDERNPNCAVDLHVTDVALTNG